MKAPNEQAPVVERWRIRYAKRGRLRFTSHRDFSRAFERALRRARVPIAFSSGFSPHPRVSYANATPTGVASEAEYLEIALNEHVDPHALLATLDAALPTGLDLVEIAPARTPDFPDRLQASLWELELRDVERTQVVEAVTAFLASTEVEVERLTKQGMRTFDARAAVLSLLDATPERDGSESHAPSAILRAVVRHLTPAVRPDDLLAALRVVGLRGAVATVTRIAQGPLDEGSGTIGDPLDPDRVEI
jgi:radical SAM-linked protein